MHDLVEVIPDKAKDRTIVFASAKGGVGKTVISVNFAVALANNGFPTCVLDGNFQFGDINLALDIQPRLTISDIAQDINSLTVDVLSNYLHIHDSGVKILSAPLKPEYADLITSPVIQKTCETILQQNDFLVVDLASGLTDNNICFMEQADTIFLVTDLEMAALKNTKVMIRTLKLLQMDNKVRVIVNRGDMESVLKFKDVKDILEVEEPVFVSDNFKVVSKSFNIGIPFVISKPREKISHEITDIAGQFFHDRYLPKRRRKRKGSLLDFFKR